MLTVELITATHKGWYIKVVAAWLCKQEALQSLTDVKKKTLLFAQHHKYNELHFQKVKLLISCFYVRATTAAQYITSVLLTSSFMVTEFILNKHVQHSWLVLDNLVCFHLYMVVHTHNSSKLIITVKINDKFFISLTTMTGEWNIG